MISVSKRYAPYLVFLFCALSSVAFAETEMIPIFGYVALEYPSLPIRERRFDSLEEPTAALVMKFEAFLKAQSADTEFEMLNAANSWVNDQIEFKNDNGDQWSSADETFASGKGDCEDHAIAKMQLLTKAGFDPDRLFFVVLKDVVRRQKHAILVAKTGGQYFVLDNGSNEVIPEKRIQDYKPNFALSLKKSWIFGIKK